LQVHETAIRWRSDDGTGLEHCVVSRRGDIFVADAVVVTPDSEPQGVSYSIRFDASWRTLAVEAATCGSAERLTLTSDGRGHWESQGRVLPELNGALAPDLSVTPLTNSLAIGLLRLKEGESANLLTAYVEFPDVRLRTDLHRYTCLSLGRAYRFESPAHDFMRNVTFGPDGYVDDYPGLFRRIPA
jgi:hypothetical protein